MSTLYFQCVHVQCQGISAARLGPHVTIYTDFAQAFGLRVLYTHTYIYINSNTNIYVHSDIQSRPKGRLRNRAYRKHADLGLVILAWQGQALLMGLGGCSIFGCLTQAALQAKCMNGS